MLKRYEMAQLIDKVQIEKGNRNMFRAFGRSHHDRGRDWEGWTPPWMNEEYGPRAFKHQMRRARRMFDEQFGPRGPFGPGGPGERRGRGPFGPEGPGEHRGRGPFGPGGPGRRFFGRGDVKYALLELLQERPMHGYEMMKALEERSQGFYTPSAGTIYPTLQMLEDRGLVTVQETEGKKVYSITDAGRAFLGERKKEEEEFWGQGNWRREFANKWRTPEMQALRSEAAEVAKLFAIAGRKTIQNPDDLAKLRTILEHTRKELSDFIYSPGQPQEEAPAPETPTE